MLIRGLIVKSVGGNFIVEIEAKEYMCKASLKIKQKVKQLLPGDIVKVDLENLYIVDVEDRKNELVRPKVANVNYGILVFSAIEPKISFNLLDKLIMIMTYNNLNIFILITKMDLIDDIQMIELKKKLKYYENIGISVVYKNQNLTKKDFLEKIPDDSKCIVTGQSGVGKSTFLNETFSLNIKTQAISKALGRGKHTTREIIFYKLDFKKNIYLLDTPGFSSLEIQLNNEEIRDNFSDFQELSKNCKFNNCYHINEPGCEVKKQVEELKILKSRYINYVKFMEEKK